MTGPHDIIGGVERYYSMKVAEHGPSPAGVDWNSAESQDLRFRQLMRICEARPQGTLIDFGCGYGALIGHIAQHDLAFGYVGYDVSPRMVREARSLHPADEFTSNAHDLQRADWVVASGVLNVRAGAPSDQWHDHVVATLDQLAALAIGGFAFNMLTSYSDAHLMREDLHYADPLEIFDHCKRRYSRHVALLHDYGLYEFTILVRNELESRS